jgi:hypothetical protein
MLRIDETPEPVFGRLVGGANGASVVVVVGGVVGGAMLATGVVGGYKTGL